jgi:hypothetical protein
LVDGLFRADELVFEIGDQVADEVDLVAGIFTVQQFANEGAGIVGIENGKAAFQAESGSSRGAGC